MPSPRPSEPATGASRGAVSAATPTTASGISASASSTALESATIASRTPRRSGWPTGNGPNGGVKRTPNAYAPRTSLATVGSVRPIPTTHAPTTTPTSRRSERERASRCGNGEKLTPRKNGHGSSATARPTSTRFANASGRRRTHDAPSRDRHHRHLLSSWPSSSPSPAPTAARPKTSRSTTSFHSHAAASMKPPTSPPRATPGDHGEPVVP
jgi:hypothetical protein